MSQEKLPLNKGSVTEDVLGSNQIAADGVDDFSDFEDIHVHYFADVTQVSDQLLILDKR